MRYKNQKFYNDQDELIPLEFGNKEQLKLIETIEALRDGVICIGPITCLCGHGTKTDFQEDFIFKCPSCGQRYKFFYYQDAVPCVKIL